MFSLTKEQKEKISKEISKVEFEIEALQKRLQTEPACFPVTNNKSSLTKKKFNNRKVTSELDGKELFITNLVHGLKNIEVIRLELNNKELYLTGLVHLLNNVEVLKDVETSLEKKISSAQEREKMFKKYLEEIKEIQCQVLSLLK